MYSWLLIKMDECESADTPSLFSMVTKGRLFWFTQKTGSNHFPLASAAHCEWHKYTHLLPHNTPFSHSPGLHSSVPFSLSAFVTVALSQSIFFHPSRSLTPLQSLSLFIHSLYLSVTHPHRRLIHHHTLSLHSTSSPTLILYYDLNIPFYSTLWSEPFTSPSYTLDVTLNHPYMCS